MNSTSSAIDWYPIENYEYYMINENGDILSLKRNTTRERILIPRKGRDGYLYVTLSENGKRHTKKIHRLVAETFISNEHNLPQVNHIDGNKINNNVNNLEWCTSSYNQKHAYSLGLSKSWMLNKKGKDCPFSKKVVQLDIDGNIIKIWDSLSDIKREMGIPTSHITRVCQGGRLHSRGYKWKYYEGGDA